MYFASKATPRSSRALAVVARYSQYAPPSVSCRGIRTLRRRTKVSSPLAPTPSLPDSASKLRPWRRSNVELQWALVTLTGQTYVTAGTDIWNGIAEVMRQVDANIEDAAGTFMPGAVALSDAAGGYRAARSRSPSFLVSAFDTHIAPFSLSHAGLSGTASEKTDGNTDRAEGVAVAIFVKASVPMDNVEEMTDRLHTRFPQLVCTLTVGGSVHNVAEASPQAANADGQAEVSADSPPCSRGFVASIGSAAQVVASNVGLSLGAAAGSVENRPPTVTGTIRLFGADQSGQLAKIAEVLAACKVTILSVAVGTGAMDPDTCDFVECPGGGLSENVINFAAFDTSLFDEQAMRRDIARAASQVGYHVSSIILEKQAMRAQELAAYYLRRKAFMTQVSSAIHFDGL